MRYHLANKKIFSAPFQLFGICLFISILGLKELFFINYFVFQSQLFKFFLALVLAILIYRFSLFSISRFALILYCFSIFLLFLVFFQSFMVKRWINLFGIYLQPSEIVKCTLLLMLSKILNKQKLDLMDLLKAIFVILIPFLAILNQPNLGTAIIILFVGLVSIWLAGIKRKYIILFSIAATIALPILWSNILPYQKARILSFLNPSATYRSGSYQSVQSIIAVGSGGILGSENFLQNKLGFVPENHTDFLFSCFAERNGFILSLLLVLLIIYGLYLCMIIFSRVKSIFGKRFISSFILLWSFESIMNIGMNLGVLPVTGVPLPFFSYGGTSLIVFFINIGIIMSFARNPRVTL